MGNDQQARERVLQLYSEGKTVPQIKAETGLSFYQARGIIYAARKRGDKRAAPIKSREAVRERHERIGAMCAAGKTPMEIVHAMRGEIKKPRVLELVRYFHMKGAGAPPPPPPSQAPEPPKYILATKFGIEPVMWREPRGDEGRGMISLARVRFLEGGRL